MKPNENKTFFSSLKNSVLKLKKIHTLELNVGERLIFFKRNNFIWKTVSNNFTVLNFEKV